MLISSGCQTSDVSTIQDKILNPMKEQVKENWTLSSTFRSGEFIMVGIPQKLGFPDNDVFVEGQPRKVMWHLWGEEITNAKNVTMEVKGVHKETGKTEHLTSGTLTPFPHNGADTAQPSLISFTKSGVWRMDVYLDRKLFGSIVVDVKKK